MCPFFGRRQWISSLKTLFTSQRWENTDCHVSQTLDDTFFSFFPVVYFMSTFVLAEASSHCWDASWNQTCTHTYTSNINLLSATNKHRSLCPSFAFSIRRFASPHSPSLFTLQPRWIGQRTHGCLQWAALQLLPHEWKRRGRGDGFSTSMAL